MKTNTKVQSAARTKPASRKFTLPITEGVIESHRAHYKQHGNDWPGCPTCRLFLASEAARAVSEHFAAARALGATKRDVAAVVVEIMAEDV